MKKTINNFNPMGGKHCITNSLKQIFSFYGYPLSEEMLFGLASGLSFLYINQSVSPMICGRTKVFEFEQKLAKRLNIKINCKSGNDYNRIYKTTKQMLDNNHPVLVYVDMAYLPYLGLQKNNHFGGHAIVIYGYDDTTQHFIVSDRDHHDYSINTPLGTIAKDFHLVSYEQMEQARSSSFKPFPSKNKYLMFDFNGYTQINKAMLQEAIIETCDTMMYPPANLLGVNGILKFSKEVKKWKNFDSNKLKLSGVTNFFQINKDGGTGGGIFRKMYGEFLIQTTTLLENQEMMVLGKKFLNVSKLWDEVANVLWQLSLDGQIEHLNTISSQLLDIYELEKSLYTELKMATFN